MDRGNDVVIAHVSQHATAQNQVCRNRAFIRFALAGVTASHFNCSGSGASSPLRERWIYLNQAPSNVFGPTMVLKNSKQITAISRAHTHHPDRPRATLIQRFGNAMANNGQASGER